MEQLSLTLHELQHYEHSRGMMMMVEVEEEMVCFYDVVFVLAVMGRDTCIV